MDEKQTRYILDLLKKQYGVGDLPQTDDEWVDSHIQNIYAKGNGRWVQGEVSLYLDELELNLMKRHG